MSERTFALALVTGATSGIGEEIAKLLASKGIDLIISGRRRSKLEVLADELGPRVVKIITADLAVPGERKDVVDAIHKLKPDLVINNAGFGLYGEALSHSTEDSIEMVNVNILALLELTLEAARTLVTIGKEGVILNVSSSAAFLDEFPDFAVYSATKAFVNHFSESLDEETSPYNIRVLAACPGVVKTGFRQRAGGIESNGDSDSISAMTSQFAAEEIWKQIQKEKEIYIFNGKYRFLIFLMRYFLPKKWVTNSIKRNMKARYPYRGIIPVDLD